MELVQLRKPEFVPPKLQITAMMDMFTIIVFFLMFSYAEKPNEIDLDKDIVLPESAAKIDHANAVKLFLTQSYLKIEDQTVARISDDRILDFDPEHPERSGLYQKLKAFHDQKSAAAAQQATEAAEDSDGASNPALHLLFFCDRTLPFKLINQVVKTAAMAGYPNFQLAVLEGVKS
jgi:hypothetical protein